MCRVGQHVPKLSPDFPLQKNNTYIFNIKQSTLNMSATI